MFNFVKMSPTDELKEKLQSKPPLLIPLSSLPLPSPHTLKHMSPYHLPHFTQNGKKIAYKNALVTNKISLIEFNPDFDSKTITVSALLRLVLKGNLHVGGV